MHRKRRQGSWCYPLNAASGTQSDRAGGLKALAHFGGKPIHLIEVQRFGYGGFLFTFQQASLCFLPSQIGRVERFGF
jgi:hypothetical protein